MALSRVLGKVASLAFEEVTSHVLEPDLSPGI